ncbi:MAG: saccharopine dehydrogenase NADP-binding domain-containing protein [Clostridiales bacterium]|nr:saccharopine dehydrogenase NADP-binding domain-containing protein [Clostridiales bacterium]
MGKVLILGSGKVANVTARKCCENPEVFSEICLTGRNKWKCDALKKELSFSNTKIITAAVDVLNRDKTLLTVKIFKPDLIINLLPLHLNLKVMDICLQARANYIDASYYYPKGSAVCGLSEQLDFHEHFEKAGLTGIVGCGFNPGVTGLFTEYAKQMLFDRIQAVDVIDANAGKNGHPYLMNSQIGKNIREISSPARYFEEGRWKFTEPLEKNFGYSFPGVGQGRVYLMDHEVIERLSTTLENTERLRYFCSFKKPFLSLVRNLQNAGMTSTEPISIDGCRISPLAFLEEVMPSPEDLAATTKGKTGIGCVFVGEKDDKNRTTMIYSSADHADCYERMRASANDYMAGTPVMVGASMILDGTLGARGVRTAEAFEPAEFLARMKEAGLSWNVIKNPPPIEE